MPRKTVKEKGTSAARSSSKRPAQETPQRQSKRARANARKSYVEPETDTDDAGDGIKKKKTLTDDEQDSVAASDYEEDDGTKEPSSESEPDATGSDEDGTTKRTPRGRPAKSLPIHKKKADESELWKPGAKLEPGTRLVIKKPKARDAGDTPYLDHTIHPNTLLFLKDLAANNDRKWLKCEYLQLSLVKNAFGAIRGDQLIMLQYTTQTSGRHFRTLPRLPKRYRKRLLKQTRRSQNCQSKTWYVPHTQHVFSLQLTHVDLSYIQRYEYTRSM